MRPQDGEVAPMTTTHVLETAGADIVYDVHGPLPTADGRPPLFMIGQPMDSTGFATLASHFPDRTVVTYDPRGLGRARRRPGPWGCDRGTPPAPCPTRRAGSRGVPRSHPPGPGRRRARRDRGTPREPGRHV